MKPRLMGFRWFALGLALAGWLAAASQLGLAQDGTQPAEERAVAETADRPPDVSAEHGIPINDFWEVMRKGGYVMWPILFCSIITLCFAFERIISLRRGRVLPRPFVKRFLHQLREGQLDRESALELCNKNGSEVAGVFAAAVRKWGRPSVEVEQAFIDAGERAGNRLRRYLRLFHAVHTICPLLGLLGTVFGVIRSFNSFSHADEAGRANMLGSGIAEALLCTAAGLTVAIVALVFYWVFVSRADQLVIEIDSLGQDFVGVISAEGLSESGQTKPRPRKREATVVQPQV